MIETARVAIFDSRGDVLILLRSDSDDHYPGQFCAPGGGVGPGEIPEEAARRELLEETGIEYLYPLRQVGSLCLSADRICHLFIGTRPVTPQPDETIKLDDDHVSWTMWDPSTPFENAMAASAEVLLVAASYVIPIILRNAASPEVDDAD